MKTWVAMTLGAAAFVMLLVEARGYFSGSKQLADNSTRWFVDADTRQPFQKKLEMGMSMPVVSPFTHKAVGYPAELCYWTKDGKPKADPTPVLLNESIGLEGPTFCPDCGRLVVGRNPAAEAGMKAPPTEAEFGQRRLTQATR